MPDYNSGGTDRSYRSRIKNEYAAGERYTHRKPGKHKAEMALVQKAFQLVPPNSTVLDIPCGAGRVTLLLTRLGYSCRGAEAAEAMVEISRGEATRAGIDCLFELNDIENMSYTDNAFDACICFRLFHHFPDPDIRRRVVGELCRVARRYVLLSYFSPSSFTSMKRSLRATLGGKKSRQHATRLSEVSAYFAAQGFTLVKDFARTPLMHTLHLAVFARNRNPSDQPALRG